MYRKRLNEINGEKSGTKRANLLKKNVCENMMTAGERQNGICVVIFFVEQSTRMLLCMRKKPKNEREKNQVVNRNSRKKI